MGRVIEFQEMITIFGAEGARQLNDKWLDLKDADEAMVSVQVLQRYPAASLSLILETALVPEGPWVEVETLSGTPAATVTEVYLTSKSSGTDRFQRYLRWRLDGQGGDQTWVACFKMGAIVR